MLYALVFLAAASRLLPHPMNFAPIGAMGLFAGAYGNRRSVWAVSIAALLVTDAVHGFYSPVVMAFVYGGFAAGAVVGRLVLRSRVTPRRLALAAFGSATAFFVLSNFGCWAAGMFPRTWTGLVQCYWMALPLFPNTLLGNLFYSAVLFGLYALARRRALLRPMANASFSDRGGEG